MGFRRTIWIGIVLVWIAAFCAAIALDARVAWWVRRWHPIAADALLRRILKLPGYFPFTMCIAGLLLLFRRSAWRVAVALLLSGPMVGLAYIVIKWIVGRRRPSIVIEPFTFHPLARGFMGLLGAEKGLSFPSGHASLAFATATCLAAAIPRWGVLFFLGAAAVAAERVLENAHYLSDVTAGAALGVACGMLALGLGARWFKDGATSPNAGI